MSYEFGIVVFYVYTMVRCMFYKKLLYIHMLPV